MKNKIEKEMKIEEVIKKYPETLSVFERFGIHCISCIAASFENIEQGALAHGIDVDKFVKELNKVVND